MYIWLIAENWPPRVGGIETYLTGIASHLPKGSIQVFAPVETAANHHDEPYVIRKRFSWKPLWPAWFPLFLFLTQQVRKQRPDVIMCGKALMEGRIARQLKKTVGIPYVVCTYGMEIATWSNGRVRSQLERVLHDADAVLYINEKTKEEILALGVAEHRLVALYPGIDVQILVSKNEPVDILKAHSINTPYILSVARLVERKGIDDLIRAFAALSRTDIQLVIAGDGPEMASLTTLAKEFAVPVKFVGNISNEELHTLYANAQLFALTPKELPEDYEGFGIVYMEAACFGLPVVATRTGGVAGAVLDGQTGILATQGDIPSITEALQKLLSDPILAKHYGSAGKQRAEKEFSWKHVISTLTTLLDTIIV